MFSLTLMGRGLNISQEQSLHSMYNVLFPVAGSSLLIGILFYFICSENKPSFSIKILQPKIKWASLSTGLYNTLLQVNKQGVQTPRCTRDNALAHLKLCCIFNKHKGSEPVREKGIVNLFCFQ